jgi:hypothetical protein
MNHPSPVRGGCLCGSVRYRFDGPVGLANYCHCADCRRVTGSAFNVGIRLDVNLFRIERGDVRTFTKASDSGNLVSRSFCPECGSPLFTSSPMHPEHVFVKAGSLDDPSLVRPTMRIWTDSEVAWGFIDPALPTHPRGRPR